MKSYSVDCDLIDSKSVEVLSNNYTNFNYFA